MDSDGWIAREQIRGPASEKRVPAKFITQSPSVANPPTLMFFFDKLLDSLQKTSNRETEEYKAVNENYEKMKKWYIWLLKTQTNDKEVPMWKGRTSRHLLPSGLDDYPRNNNVYPGERHLDMYMWLVMFAKTLIKATTILENKSDAIVLQESLDKLLSYEELFVDEDGMLKDYFPDNQTLRVEKDKRNEEECYNDTQDSELNKKSLFSEHIGYVSLMPLIAGFVKPSTLKFTKIIDVIKNRDHLWSDCGLRTLSKSDALFKTDENYWRGRIWINFNFLVLRALKNYYWTVEGIQQLYTELRQNVVDAVRNSWAKTGYFWEQYDDPTGEGKGTPHFTGWTTLVLNIIHEKY
jgi:mannosyl-oligosaccharide glucosidase